MSYGVRYSCEWRSPMRERSLYIIEILERDYTGKAGLLYPTGDVVTITQGRLDDNEFEPIKASEAVMSMLCVEEGDPYMSLFTSDPLRFKLRIQKTSLSRKLLYWEGFLVAGTYAQDYALPPYRVELRATDGLALLKDIPYLDETGERYTGVRTLSAIVEDIMSRISTWRVLYPYSMENIEPEQLESSMTVVGLESEGIYSSLGKGEVPSCYDVLEAILQSMQCQLFQSYGAWVVRPLISLATNERPSSIRSIVNNGYADIPLYGSDEDGLGMSTSARLSLLTPYKKLTISRPSASRDPMDVPSMLLPGRWRAVWGNRRSAWAKNDMMRLAVYGDRIDDRAWAAAYVFDGIMEASTNTSVSVSMDVYNLAGEEKTFRAGLLLVAEGDDPIESWNTALLQNVENVAIWNGTSWTTLRNLDDDISGNIYQPAMLDVMAEVTLEASPRYVLFDIPSVLDRMSKTVVDVSATHVYAGPLGRKYKLVLVFAGIEGVPEIEIRNPKINITCETSVNADVMYDNAVISASGMGEVGYKQVFADSWMLPVTNSMFEAPLLNTHTNTVLRGVVSPSQRSLLTDVAVSAMQRLRGGIVRQLEGDVYAKTNVDLDAIWVERSGRRFYTNYIRRNMRRGIYNVQLRELPALSVAVHKPSSLFSGAITDLVAMDTSAMWLSSNGRKLYRYDAQKDTITNVVSSPSGSYAMSLNAGQMCASVILFDGVHYTLIAYNTHGEVLSRIEQAQLLVQVYDTTLVDIVMRSARYDANVQTWVLIGGDSRVTYTQLLSSDGYNVASYSATLSGYTNAYAQNLIPNGYVYSTKVRTTDTAHTTYWHSYAQHRLGELGKFKDNAIVRACNEIYILVEEGGVLSLYARTDTEMGYGPAALHSVNASQYNFVGMNNALALFQKIDGYGAEVYDGRTGNVLSLSAPLALPGSILWLSGEFVYGTWIDNEGVYHITSERVIGGVGYATYITSDGFSYKTSDGYTYLAIK